jgi:hypothetical protein
MTGAEREVERIVAVLAGIELGAERAVVEQPAGVVHRDMLTGAGAGAAALDHIVNDQAAGGGDAHAVPFKNCCD